MPKALFVVTNTTQLGDSDRPTGFHLSEVTHPLDAFVQAGYEVDFVSPLGGKSPIVAADREDDLNAAFLDSEERMRQVENTLSPDAVDSSDYEAVFYAGGHGTMWDFAEAESVGKIAAEIYEAGGVVGAVCHGPAGLLPIRLNDGTPLVANKKVAAFTDAEEVAVDLQDTVPFSLSSALEDLGAEHVPAANFTSNVVVSDRLVTGQNPASAGGVGQEIVAVLAANRV